MDQGFFAILSRMKYINRWNLMRNIREETLTEHSFEVALLAQALALIGVECFGAQVSPDTICAKALYHDCSEIITGDMPTPVKYHDQNIRKAYKDIEHAAQERLLHMLPEKLQEPYSRLFNPTATEERYIKAADKISAYLKCISERQGGNLDFVRAEQQLQQIIADMHMPEADYFMAQFAPCYGENLDTLLQEKS